MTQGHFFPVQGVHFHLFPEGRKLSKKASLNYYRWSLRTVTVADSVGSLTQGQISEEKNDVVAISVSTRPRKLWISLLLQYLPVSLASYCIVFSLGRPTVQELLQVEVDGKPHTPHGIPLKKRFIFHVLWFLHLFYCCLSLINLWQLTYHQFKFVGTNPSLILWRNSKRHTVSLSQSRSLSSRGCR